MDRSGTRQEKEERGSDVVYASDGLVTESFPLIGGSQSRDLHEDFQVILKEDRRCIGLRYGVVASLDILVDSILRTE